MALTLTRRPGEIGRAGALTFNQGKSIMENALGVSIDGESIVCMVCAEDAANKGGAPNLFWAINVPEELPADAVCKCGSRFGALENEAAADRVFKLLFED